MMLHIINNGVLAALLIAFSFFCCCCCSCNALLTQQQQTLIQTSIQTSIPIQIQNAQFVASELKLSTKSSSTLSQASKSQRKPCLCPEDDDDVDNVNDNDEDSIPLLLLEDRREALFGMMGSLWAAGALPTALLFPEPADATYGSDANMELPNVLEGLSDRNNKQCLVESLGNRQCLVYREDEEKLLYKGANAQVLLERIGAAAKALEYDIPPMVEKKQWIQITGVLTGPMGQLSATLTSLSQLADDGDGDGDGDGDNRAQAKQKAQIVKASIFAMGTAATNKQADQVLQFQQQALLDLAIFLKSL